MDKKNLLRSLDVISYLAIINATIFLILFQYAGSEVSLKIALVSYIVAFLICIAFCVLRLYFNYKNTDEEFMLVNKQKIWLFIKSILCLILFIFAVLILILW